MVLKATNSGYERVHARLDLAEALMASHETTAYIHLLEAVALSEQLDEPELMARAYYQLGHYNTRNLSLNAGIVHFEKALENYIKDNDRAGEANANNQLGIIYARKGFESKALNYFLKTLEIRKELEDFPGVASAYNNMGNVHEELEEYNQAEYYYMQALEIRKVYGKEVEIASSYMNLGLLNMEHDMFIESKMLLNQAISILEDSDRRSSLGMSYLHLGNVYKHMGMFDSAHYFIDHSMEILMRENDLNGELFAKISIARLYIEEEKFESAIELAKETLKESMGSDLRIAERDCYYNLFEAYQGAGNHEKALEYYISYSNINDSIVHSHEIGEARRMEESISLERQQETISKIKEKALQSKKIWEQDWFIVGLFLALLVALITTIERSTRFGRKNIRSDYGNINYLRSARILYLTAAILYTSMAFVLPAVYLYDPIWLRLVIAGAITAAYIGTFYSEFIIRKTPLLIKVLYSTMVVHHFFLLYKSDIAIPHVLFTVLILAGLPAVFKKLWSTLIFCVFVLFLAVIVSLTIEQPLLDMKLFISTIAAILVISMVMLLTRVDLNKQLELSNEVVNRADALMFVVNDKGNIVYTGKSIEKILGHSVEHFNGPNWIEKLGVEKEKAALIKDYLIGIATGTLQPPFEIEYQRFLTKDGKEKWFSMRDQRIEKDRMLVIGIDVTERKLIEDELVRSEHNFRQMNETLNDVFYLFDVTNQKYEYISPNSIHVIGASPEYFYNGNSYTADYVLEQDREMLKEAWDQVEQGESYEVEFRVLIDGKVRWIREKSYPIMNDEGEVIRNSGLCQDITDIKQAAKEIEMLSMIASHTSNYVIIADREKGIEWVNEAFIRKFGYTQEEVKGKYPSAFMHEHKNSNLIENINQVLFIEKQRFRGEVTLVTKFGQEIYSNVDITPLFNRHGMVKKYFVLGVDISQRKGYEDEIRRIADQLEIVHAIENKILTAESTEEIIYNTLNTALDKLPIIRASLALFNYSEGTFHSYARMQGDMNSNTDKKVFDLTDFTLLNKLNESSECYYYNIKERENKTVSDEMIIAEGAEFALMSPLFNESTLMGSFNVCFEESLKDEIDYFIEVTNEVATGLAIAIRESRLKEQLHRSNASILSGISYAKMIQEAYVPDIQELRKYFAESFVINRPKDLVSGDFYWVGKNGDKLVLAVADCTGHGVPGALMTMIGISELNNIINQRSITQPAQILNELNIGVTRALSTNEHVQLKDGMDIGICSFDLKSGEITYSGARRPLYYFSAGKLEIIEGTRLSIGENIPEYNPEYSNTTIHSSEVESFYLFSDGYPDQFGGERGRKFGKIRLQEALIKAQTVDLMAQKEIFEKALNDWQKERYQTDDILMVGFKLQISPHN